VKQKANSAVARLLDRDVNSLTDETVVIDVSVLGNLAEPAIKTSLAEVVKGATQQVTEAAKQEAEKQLQDELAKKKKEAAEQAKEKLKGLFKR